MIPERFTCFLLGAALCLLAPTALAQAPHAGATTVSRSDPTYYRGRTSEPAPEEVLAWIPRILFMPVHLVLEYLVRLPLHAFLEWAEREHVLDWVDLVLHPAPGMTWHPSVTLETGFTPVGGLVVRWRDLFVQGHDVRAAFSVGGDDLWDVSFRDRWSVGPVRIGMRELFSTRPNRPFYGLGPYSSSTRTNYTHRRAEVEAVLEVEHENYVLAAVSAGYSDEETEPGNAPSMETQFELASVPGFGHLALAIGSVALTLDTRRELEENGGVRFHGASTFALDTQDADRSFMTWQADLEGAVEVSYPDRVLAARVHVADSVPFGSAAVPFTHMPTLGQDTHRGFTAGRFRGESAFAAEVRYRYPVAYFVDFQLIASIGNVFGPQFSGFAFEAMTASFALGLRTRRTGDDPIDFTVGLGTTRFDDESFGVDSIRVYLSTTHGL